LVISVAAPQRVLADQDPRRVSRTPIEAHPKEITMLLSVIDRSHGGECPACSPIKECLSTRLRGRAHDIRLLVRDDGVILQGSSHTHYVKQLAQQAVMEVTNLPVLANEIQVR